MRKGQITIFIILAAVLITSAIFIFYVRTSIKKVSPKQEEQYQTNSVKNSADFFTKSCIDKVLKESLDKLGENGGYIYKNPNLKIQYTQDYIFTFLYIDRANFLPSIDSVKFQIEKYINENLRYCIDDFVFYEQQGWSIKIPKVKSNITMGENEVIASIEFPVNFIRDKTTFSLDKFFTINNVPLKKILEGANGILNDAEKAQKEVDEHNAPEIPLQSFTKNDLLFLNYQYPDTGRFLWIIKEKEYEFFFAINLEI